MSTLLETITALSHEFGSEQYVQGGGGNTSAKDAETIWVKPSGTTLAGIRAENFLPMSRAKLQDVHNATPPTDVNAREAMVKDLMMAAICDCAVGRPSVEAPLHDSFEATYVVHTHPALVNGMTCSCDGKAVCQKLFPDSLWVDFVDPGFVLSRTVREAILAYKARHGNEPEAVFLQNHGVFVAGNTAEDIRRVYTTILSTLEKEYKKAGVATTLPATPAPSAADVQAITAQLKAALGEKASFVFSAGPAVLPEGPLSPDHIVYAKSFMLLGEPTAEAIAAFQAKNGYAPQAVSCRCGVFGLGASEKVAKLALVFAMDGALVKQLTAAFGGVLYMDDRARKFIENWEVESYRQKQI